MTKPRYVVDWNFSVLMHVFSEIMNRTNVGPTTPDEMLHVSAISHPTGTGISIKGSGHRQVLITHGDSKNMLYVRFYEKRDVDIASLFYDLVPVALDAVEEFIFKGISPRSTK